MVIGKFLFLKQRKSKNPKLRIETLNAFRFGVIFSMILLGSFLFVKSASAHPYISNPGTLLDGFENVNDWTVGGTGATAENDTSIFKQGNQSIKINAVGSKRQVLL